MRLIAAAVAVAGAAVAVNAHKATHLQHLLRFSVNWLELHTHTHTQTHRHTPAGTLTLNSNTFARHNGL